MLIVYVRLNRGITIRFEGYVLCVRKEIWQVVFNLQFGPLPVLPNTSQSIKFENTLIQVPPRSKLIIFKDFRPWNLKIGLQNLLRLSLFDLELLMSHFLCNCGYTHHYIPAHTIGHLYSFFKSSIGKSWYKQTGLVSSYRRHSFDILLPHRYLYTIIVYLLVKPLLYTELSYCI